MTISLWGRQEEDPGGALRRKQRPAWDHFVAEQYRRIYSLHLRLSGDPETAADLTQETFVAAYQSISTFAGRSRPETWLYGVALNCSRNWRRRQGSGGPEESLEEDLPDPAPTAEQLTLLRERADLLTDAVRRLPEPYRHTVALRHWGGATAEEIALTDGVDAGTVRWRLHQAMGKLWVMLQPHLGLEERS
jgi:RNA polymerase sigma-70 factor, ECF subfamily